MMNNVMLICRLKNIIENDGKVIMYVSTDRPKNEGKNVDIIPVLIDEDGRDMVKEYCVKGDVMGVRGTLRVESNNLYVKAQKLSLLTSKAKKED